MSTTDTNTPARIAVIIGSVRQGRIGPTVAQWFYDHASKRDDLTLDLIDLADFNFPPDMSQNDDVAEFRRRIGAADGIVVVTPEYNHSFSGPLKTAIDSLKQEWYAKPVAFIAYGGMSGGLRAVEPLRGVFAELHATTIRETVSFHGVRSQFNDEGQPVNPEGVNAAADVLLKNLLWWANALRTARAAHPYGS